MKKSWIIFLILLYGYTSILANNYGLHFKSHSVPGTRRTSLILNPNKHFILNEEFSLSFDASIRDEPKFGNIFSIKTNDGQIINVIYAFEGKDTYSPAVVINGTINPMDAEVNSPQASFNLTLYKKQNKISLAYNKKVVSFPIQLDKVQKLTIIFGVPQVNDRNDVAPVNIRDIRIFNNKRNTHHWELKHHNDNLCYDIISQSVAVAVNPHWIINDHVEWQEIYTQKTKEKIQSAFNPKENLFYLVQQDCILLFDPKTNQTATMEIKEGHRAMTYSNYLEYDTLSNTLLSYSIEQNIISRFNMETQSWSSSIVNTDEPTYTNHTWATNDTAAYIFGGYGFYHFKNDLFEINLIKNEIKKCQYTPSITPRTSAASAIVGDNLYIFGGRGNSSGRQELPSQYYYDLHLINLKTMKSRKIWEIKDIQNSFIQASTMHYSPEDSSFYAATTDNGGTLIKLSMNEPKWKYVSKPISAEFLYKDMVYNLYSTEKQDKMYLLIDKRLNNADLSHDLTIYSIDCPLLENDQIEQILIAPWYKNKILLSVPLFVILIFFVLLGIKIHRQRTKSRKEQKEKSEQELDVLLTVPTDQSKESLYFDRSKSAISFLGGFKVKDKNGENITNEFTPRLKSLFIILLLYSAKHPQGILVKKLDEIIWSDKDEESARNNRNVYIRKLRLLLTNIGNIEVINDKGFFRLEIGKDVFFDYNTVLTQIAEIENMEIDDEELINKILELLLYGSLLPNTTYEWLDDFKGNYSSTSITLLTNLLSRELNSNNYNLAIRIADTMFLHDPLNEEALSAKCSILYNRGMKGISKKVYDRFSKEYSHSLGEKYKVPFTDVIAKKNS